MNLKKHLIILLGLGQMLCLSCKQQPALNIENSSLEIALQIPKLIQAGQSTVFDTNLDRKGLTTVQFNNLKLIITHGLGTVITYPTVHEQRIIFNLPGLVVQRAGEVQFTLLLGQDELLQGKFTVLSSAQFNPQLDAFVGPPSLIVDQNDPAMIVAIPTDIYGNLMPNSTPINISTQRQDKTQTTQKTTQLGLTYIYLEPEAQVGKIKIAVTAQQAQSKSLEVLLTPGTPSNFEIVAHRVHNYADGSENLKLSTGILTDSFNNIVANGTAVQFNIQGDRGGLITANGFTVNGIAQTQLAHPSQADSWSITANIGQQSKTTNTLEIDFKPAIAAIDSHWDSDESKLIIGPLTGNLGQLIADGTQVALYNKQGQKIASQQTINGTTTFDLTAYVNKSTPEEIVVKVLGITKMIIF